MSFVAGLLGGAADGLNARRDRADRLRELSVMEAMGKAEAAGGSAASASAAPADGGTGASFTYDGKIGDRPMYAFNYFRSQGLPDHVAAGLVGNLMQESGVEINPAAVGDNGNAFGSGQWNGPRKDSYMAFAKARGVDPTDYDTQLAYLMHEGQTTEKGAWSKIMAAKTPEEAATLASQYFWRPGMPHNERRVGYATSIFRNRPASPTAMPAAAAAPTKWRWFQNNRGQG